MKKLFLLFVFCFGFASTAAFAQDGTETEDLTDYKTACLAAIDNISLIGNNFAMRSMISVAKASLNVCNTKDDMRRAMTALRAGVTSYLQTTKTFQNGQVFTGLLGNHSFDTGDLSLWYCLGFDLSQLSLTEITSAMSGGDVSGLVNAISVNEWNEDTKAVENEGSNAISNGDQKYYLNSTQLMMQPIIGLPAGIYSISAKVACTPGLFRLNKVHLCALVVPTSVAQEVLGDVLSNGNWEELFSNFDMMQYIAPFLQAGKLYSGSVSCQNINTFSDGELRFIIDEGDIVIIGMNAGMVPFVGTEQFRADNLQLTGLRAANGILAPAKADLAAALQGLETVKANYNADGTNALQPAFSYDKTITEQYNQALLSAQEKYDNDKLADILTKENLNNPDGIDDALKNYYNKDIQTLNSARERFDKQAFIAPTTDEAFNILMKDDWISLTGKWTGNAVCIDESMTMRFSQQPGQSVFTLAFSFERASDEYTNQLRAFVSDGHEKYYLGERDGSLVLTTEPSEAVTITALPSYTEEGEISLMVGDMYLGTSNSSNTFVKTNSGTLLRPTRTGLSVLPASEMEITLTIPADRNAATLILPFDAELPEGIIACSVTGIETMVNGESASYIVHSPSYIVHANVPYVIMVTAPLSLGEEWTETFKGVPHAVLPSYAEGLLTGRHTPYTTQDGNEYKMTTSEDGYSVFQRMDGQAIAENECYLKCDHSDDVIFVTQADAATGISDLTPTPSSRRGEIYYDLSGRKISTFNSQLSTAKRGLYIHNGKKLLFKE